MIQALRRSTSGRPRNPPSWRFAPNAGGAEQGANLGWKHFSAGAFTNTARESLKNSPQADRLPEERSLCSS